MTAKPHRTLMLLLALGLLGVIVYFSLHHFSPGHYAGVDDSVVGKFAKDAGRPAKPLIDLDKYGDLPLFIFLLAGLAGGFVLGYCFRSLFGAKDRGPTHAPDA